MSACKEYTVTVSGCDDETSITIPLLPEEFAIVNAVALKITAASTYGCMPKMRVIENGSRSNQGDEP